MRSRSLARVAWVAIASGLLVAWAGARVVRADQPAPRAHPSGNASWLGRVKSLIKQDDCRAAMPVLDDVLAGDPTNGLAQAYHSLCEGRLRETTAFGTMSPAALERTKREQQQETAAQRQSVAARNREQRAIERQQDHWDAQIAHDHRQFELQERQRQRREAADAKARALSERQTRPAPRPAAAPVSAPTPPAVPASPMETPALPAQRASGASASKQSEEEHGTETPPSRISPPVGAGGPPPEVAAPSQPAIPSQPPAPVPPATPTRAAPPVPPAIPTQPVTPTKPSPSTPVELEPIRVPTSTAPAARIPSKVGTPGVPGSVEIFADHMSVAPDRQLATAEGNVRVVFDGGLLTCDKMSLFTDTKDLYAQGRVLLEYGTNTFRAELVHFNVKTKKGRILEGTAHMEPWYEHGRVIEHVAEDVVLIKSGYVTSCEFDPPHFRFQGQHAIVFTNDRIARGRNAAFWVGRIPLLYLPAFTLSEDQSPFFLVPGKRKPWGEFVLSGYHYHLPGGHSGTARLDWRRNFLWGMGVDHRFESNDLGKGLIKVYYNKSPAVHERKENLVKGADGDRYRVLIRHQMKVLPDTTVITDIQKFSDENFRKEFLFREEYTKESSPESFVSMITNSDGYGLNVLMQKRLNRFETTTESLPDATLDIRSQRIGTTPFYVESKLEGANLQTKTAHSDNDTDVILFDGFQQVRYAMNWFRPVLVTPRAGVRQTFYTKDRQGGVERPQGQRNIISGQFSTGADASLKLFRIFPVATNWMNLNINGLRHVISPGVNYTYVRPPTVPNELLSFPRALSATNNVTLSFENKLQTKRMRRGVILANTKSDALTATELATTPSTETTGAGVVRRKPRAESIDLARAIVSLPYTFTGSGNKQGGRYGDWSFDVETYPWPWMRLESDWIVPSHFVRGTRNSRIQIWNGDLIMVGGRGTPIAQQASDIQAPTRRAFQPGPQESRNGLSLLPQGQWYLGFGHRYSENDKTESVIQFDWRLSEKWQIGTFHRITWKEVAGNLKRFNNLRETQYTLTRDLHDWIAELVYRVDREFGEELFLTVSLKAYPDMPIALSDSYHQPKVGSQDSPFSPVARH